MSGQLVPYAAAEVTAPIVGQLFSLMPRQDMEELTVRSIWILTSLFEPFMFIRAMVHHQIHHDGYTAFLAFGNQAIHILKCAESGINIVVIGNVVSLIRHGRAVYRRKPQNLNAQFL